ncbi:MAG: COR domain-containing protein [Azospirillaceae bacterium]|nr:COR domain-containing protein [Azospirillaceae bacterium]
MAETDGLTIARRRIANEASHPTGVLDLGQLGLTTLPDALFGLKHLRRLNLGASFIDDDGKWRECDGGIDPNDIQSSLTRLTELPALHALFCRGTAVTDLTPLAGLFALQTLDCSDTKVTDLAPLAGLFALQELDCSGTAVTDLTPLVGLPALRSLDCSECLLTDLPDGLVRRPSLERLVLYDTDIPGIPAAVLSQDDLSDCLGSLRAHLDDLRAGPVAVCDVKLMVLGNGRVGKTQICRRLRGEDYDGDADSTHGIVVTAADLAVPRAGDPGPGNGTRLHLWDFGGQDIYHGTHALFLRAAAIFLVVWAPEFEDTTETERDGVVFRNRPLGYWLEFVRQFGGRGAAVLIVQTRCDRPEDEVLVPPLPDPALTEFGFRKILHYSALKDRGRAALDEALREATAWLRARQGVATIGAGRHRVQRRLEAMRDADAAVPPAQRQYRTLTQGHFGQICAEGQDVGDPGAVLAYLANSGIVFYRDNLFDDRIVLDQGWALDAIYAVFNRKKCVTPLRLLHGRFSRSLLEALVWQDYREPEQKLFLDMMVSCGIAFVFKPGDPAQNIETEYIAPDLLPPRAAVEAALQAQGEVARAGAETVFAYPLLHPGLIRGIIARIGGEAGLSALYWRDGVCVYETETRSHALIEQEITAGWHGTIRLRTQGGQEGVLAARLTALIEEVARGIGLARSRTPTADRPAVTGAEPLRFGNVPAAAARRRYVSYAWNDDKTPEGRDRETKVDQLCDAAQARGQPIIRDKTALRRGDLISKFMTEIGTGDRVFVFLSDKYLKSPFCMTELFGIWRNSRQDEAEFQRRVRVYTVASARIWTLGDRLRYATYWEQQHNKLDAAIRDGRASLLGERDLREFRLMQEFSHHVMAILALIADTVQARDFDDFLRNGFDDDPDPD